MTKLIDIRMICCLLLSMLYPLDGEGIKFYGVNSMNEMKYLFKNTNVIFFTENEFDERRQLWYWHDNAHFATLAIDGFPTECGEAKVKLDFFNDKLYCVQFENIELKDRECYESELINFKDKNSNVKIFLKDGIIFSEMSICDSALKKEVLNWIRRWS